MNKILWVAGLITFSSASFAGSRYQQEYQREYRNQNQGQFQQHNTYDREYRDGQGRDGGYAEVIDVEPIYTNSERSIPRQVCSDYTVRSGGGNNGNALFGAVVGGVVGHQFGAGSGRDIATAVGALWGASALGGSGREHARVEQRCYTQYEPVYSQQVTSYNVTYRYRGRVYNTQMPYNPGNRIYVESDVRPVY